MSKTWGFKACFDWNHAIVHTDWRCHFHCLRFEVIYWTCCWKGKNWYCPLVYMSTSSFKQLCLQKKRDKETKKKQEEIHWHVDQKSYLKASALPLLSENSSRVRAISVDLLHAYILWEIIPVSCSNVSLIFFSFSCFVFQKSTWAELNKVLGARSLTWQVFGSYITV